MAKRDTGVGKMRKTHSRKTKKRLEAKRVMLEMKAKKPRDRKQKKQNSKV